MLLRIKADPDWLGDISYVDTTAVTSIVNQEVHHPGNIASRAWYVISAGTRVGIFISWYVFLADLFVEACLSSFRHDTAPYAHGINGSIYCRWPSRAEAFTAFQHALILGTVRLIRSS